MALFANMCVTLWGSIIVFGKNPNDTYSLLISRLSSNLLSSHVYVQFIMNFLGHYGVVSYENVHLPTGRPDSPDGNRGKLSVTKITHFFASNNRQE